VYDMPFLKWKKFKNIIISLLTGIILTSCYNIKAEGEPDMSLLLLQDPGKFNITMNDKNINISWDSITEASSYDIYRSGSRLGDYTFLATVKNCEYTDSNPNSEKFENYYLVTARNKEEKIQNILISFELKMFGKNMKFYDIKYDSISKIEEDINKIHDMEMFGNIMVGSGRRAEFTDKRYALYFKPGEYRGYTRFKIGFYTHVSGLGNVPGDTKLFGTIETPPHLPDNNATCTFWRSIENLGISGGSFKWAVSQAAPIRRLMVNVPAVFDWNGWASGGYSADTYFASSAGSWSQQQWYSRNSHHEQEFFGVNWNKFVQGATGNITPDNWVSGGSATKIDTTPVIREKPFLFIQDGRYKVFVPALRREAVGTSWSESFMGNGIALDIENDFYVAMEGFDTAQTINTALEKGKHIFFTPGRYELTEPIQITNAGTVILGTGYATLYPSSQNSLGAMFIHDVGNVIVAGLVFDAGENSVYLLCAGEYGSDKDHSASPTLLSDIFVRVGGYTQNNVNVDGAVIINSNDVRGDHFWIWRADHGQGIGWN